MKILKELDLTAEAVQLRLVMKLRNSGGRQYQTELDTLHRMLARKTLEYYGEDGYDAFFERHHFDYATDDGYQVMIRGHEMSVRIETPCGTVTGYGSTWDYTPGDLEIPVKPADMAKADFAAIKKRMEEIEDSERIVYPFHPLHRIGNGIFDTGICMYKAHILLKEERLRSKLDDL